MQGQPCQFAKDTQFATFLSPKNKLMDLAIQTTCTKQKHQLTSSPVWYSEVSVIKTLLGLFFVRLHIEYANVVWSLHLRKPINLVERVRRRSTKRWAYTNTYTNTTRLRFHLQASMKIFNLHQGKSKTWFLACPKSARRLCQRSTNKLVLFSID